MRGYGKNTMYINDLSYNGFSDQLPPSRPQNTNLILEKTTLDDTFNLKSGNSDLSNCETICDFNPSCRGFVHDTESNFCSTYNYIDTENILDAKMSSLSPSPVYTKLASNIYIPNSKIQNIQIFY